MVDVNDRKAGRYIGGSGQQIVTPSALAGLRPQTVVLMNPLYADEVRTVLDRMGLAPELVAA